MASLADQGRDRGLLGATITSTCEPPVTGESDQPLKGGLGDHPLCIVNHVVGRLVSKGFSFLYPHGTRRYDVLSR